MRNFLLFLILGLQFALVPVARSQPQLESENKIGLSYILKFNGVAKDLGLSDEQNEQLVGLWTEIETHLEYAFQEYQANYSPRFSAEEQEELRKALVKKIDEVRQTETGRLEEVLQPEQLNRLKQIRFQILKRNSDGLKALVSELELTGDQINQIKKIETTMTESIQGFLEYARNQQLTQNEIAEEVQALREEHEKDLLAILSPEQLAKLKELEGEPFQVQTGEPKKSDQ